MLHHSVLWQRSMLQYTIYGLWFSIQLYRLTVVKTFMLKHVNVVEYFLCCAETPGLQHPSILKASLTFNRLYILNLTTTKFCFFKAYICHYDICPSGTKQTCLFSLHTAIQRHETCWVCMLFSCLYVGGTYCKWRQTFLYWSRYVLHVHMLEDKDRGS